jgi:hypothetical protein
MAILTVGPGKLFATIVAAVTAAHNGDTLEVQAGTYVNQSVSIRKDLTLQGVGGVVTMTSIGSIPNGKAILVIDGNVIINNFAFSGARVADHNGAGIKQQSGNLVLNNCAFFDNEMGVLTGDTGTLTINKSEFAYNGVSPLYSPSIGHNLYAGRLMSLTVNASYFHEAAVGHEIKSRALSTTIANSRVYDLNGTSSYSIDLPNGGDAVIRNNVIEQGPLSQNPKIITYGEEGALNPGTNFLISGNIILNDKPGIPIGIRNATPVTAQIVDNKFFGLTPGQIASGRNKQTGNQFLPSEPLLDTTHPWLSGALLGGQIAVAGISGSDRTGSSRKRRLGAVADHDKRMRLRHVFPLG